MPTRSLPSLVLTACLALSGASLLACTASTDAAVDDQAPETPESAESEARAKTTFTRLDAATADQVADELTAAFERDLATVLAAHPDIQTVTRSNVSRLTSVGVTSYANVREVIVGILDDLGQQSAKPSTLRANVRAWALAKVAPHVKNGVVKHTGVSSLALYDAVRATEEKLSITRATKARGVDLAELRGRWAEVQSARDTLDSDFLRPVKVSKEPSVTEIKKHYGIRGALVAWGWEAIDRFHAAGEGPDGAREFEPIARSLKHSIGIKKRFFFEGGGEGWSNHVLVVMDERNQLFGFSMGYSE